MRGGRRRANSPRQQNTQPSKVVGIFGLSNVTSEDAIRKLMEQFGKIEKCQLIVDRQTNVSKGFAFTYFENLEDAKAAKEKIAGQVRSTNCRY